MDNLKRYENLIVNLMLAVLVALFAIGVWAPILTLKKLLFVHNTFSILSGIGQLAVDGQYVLFLLITLFTLILPCCKIAVLFTVWNTPPNSTKQRYVGWLSAIGKWSMLDVFVVAVLITSVKLGALASVEVHYGLYVFTAAVILMMAATHFMYRRINLPVKEANVP